jgi:GNAT superfamily N-acetyltransferase
MVPQIRRIRADEWREMRSLRLRALAEVPTAYGSTLAEEQAYSDDVWRERTLGASSGYDRATFIAECEGMWLATVTGLAKQFGLANGVPLLVAMFVAASARRQGIGVGLGSRLIKSTKQERQRGRQRPNSCPWLMRAVVSRSMSRSVLPRFTISRSKPL